MFWCLHVYIFLICLRINAYLIPSSNWRRIYFQLNLINNGKNQKSPSSLRFDELKSNEVMFLKSIRNRSKEKTLISRDERLEVEHLLEHHLPKMSASNIANTAFSLVINNVNENDLSALLVAMSKFGVIWTELCDMKSIENILEENIKKMNYKSLGDTIWAIANMGVQYSQLTPSCRYSMIHRLNHESKYFNLYQLPSILWAFAKMGLKWNDLEKNTQISFANILQNNSTIFTPQQSSKVLWSLGGIGCNFDNFPNEFYDEYLNNINDLKKSKMGFAFSASQTLTGLAKMNVKWERISPSSKYIVWEQLLRVCQGSNNQGLSNAVWAVGSIGIPMDEMIASQRVILWDSINKALPLCTGWELTNILW